MKIAGYCCLGLGIACGVAFLICCGDANQMETKHPETIRDPRRRKRVKIGGIFGVLMLVFLLPCIALIMAGS